MTASRARELRPAEPPPRSVGETRPRTELSLPFCRLNLRFNPFGELDVAELQQIAVVDVEQFLPALSGPRAALQFMGDKGAGKSTHLLAIWRRLPGSLYLYFPEQKPRPQIPADDQLAAGACLLLDEAQRLSRRQLRAACRLRRPLVLGTHECLAGVLRRRGFQTTTVHVSERTTVDRLEQCFKRRIELARRGPGPVPSVSRDTAERLHREFGGDIRAMLHVLYKRFQKMKEVEDA